MWIRSFVGAVLLLVLTSASTSAFELTPAGPADQSSSGALVAPSVSGDGAGLTDDEKSQVAVPGLGSFSLIPKLNFGLELLYSGEDSASGAPATDSPDDGIAIHGALKQSF